MTADGGGDEVDPFIGAVISGRFRIDSLLGEGGMGRVYLGSQVRLDRKCAIKVLHPHFAARKDMAMRFQREAKAASMLNHPNSVIVYDFGAWQGQLYIAMEYLEGRGLDRVLMREHPLSPERVVYFMLQLCDVLSVAHKMELLHRDLKPENLVIIKDNEGRDVVKVVDFGLAYLMEGDKNQRLTQDGSVSGTPAYMSPEQALDKPLDRRSDIYAVGCILYELLCGVPPFEGSSPVECLAMHLYDEPIPPSKRARHTVDRALETTALWCLEKKPENRPQSVDDLKVALQESIDRPDDGAMLAAALQQTTMSRDARVHAAGVPTSTRIERPAVDAGLSVIVYQPDDMEFSGSAATVLRSQAVTCDLRGEALAAPPALEDGEVDAVIVDIRGREQASLDTLAWWLTSAALGTRPVLVVGGDESFDAMTRALEIGAADYVPESNLTKLPKKLGRAVRRTKKG